MSITFENLGLSPKLIEGLKKENIVTPTNIQLQAIPEALEGKDIIGHSETGSGKTLAYLLPIFEQIDTTLNEVQAYILAPTHELVVQINREIQLLATNSDMGVRSTTLVGNVNIKRQLESLKKKNPHIVVGTSCRILEIIKMRKLRSHYVKTIVLDEGDKLLDKNNVTGVKDLIKTALRDVQIMLFMATINDKAMTTAEYMLKDLQYIKADTNKVVNTNIDHYFITADYRDKISVLRKLIAGLKPTRAIIFINKSEEIEKFTGKLIHHDVKATGIYGASKKHQRKQALDNFRNGKTPILVASDLAARGLDIKDVTHIFSVDIPDDPNEYLHRAGRTGRAGTHGISISIVSEPEVKFVKGYERSFDLVIEEKSMVRGALDVAKPKDESTAKGPKSDAKPVSKKDAKNKYQKGFTNDGPKFDKKAHAKSKDRSESKDGVKVEKKKKDYKNRYNEKA